ncbi:MAG: zinc-binding dehydrogenase [Promethearchaeota archaeon]
MRGAMYLGKNSVEIRDDLPMPILKPNEVMVKPKYVGICGSGVESFKSGGLYLPNIILGHEFSGDVVEIGEKVKKIKIGDRVAINPVLPCHDCYWCNRNQENMCSWESYGTSKNGAMAEFINVEADRIHHLPDTMSYQEGATVEPLANCVFAVQESRIMMGENATVFGAGTIGLMTIQALKVAGASDIYAVEPIEFKQKKALELGASKVLKPKETGKIKRLTNKIGPDHIFDCVGVPETVTTSLGLIRRGGHITIIGIHVDPFEMRGWMQVPLNNVAIRGTYSFTTESFATSLKLIAEKRVNGQAIITKIIKLDEVPKMFEILSNPPHEEIKVLVEIE